MGRQSISRESFRLARNNALRAARIIAHDDCNQRQRADRHAASSPRRIPGVSREQKESGHDKARPKADRAKATSQVASGFAVFPGFTFDFLLPSA
jgi:hypothetical protein